MHFLSGLGAAIQIPNPTVWFWNGKKQDGRQFFTNWIICNPPYFWPFKIPTRLYLGSPPQSPSRPPVLRFFSENKSFRKQFDFRSYTPMDKDLACDIHVVNLRTMLKTQYKMEPSDNSALILHRQGFNACYKPVGLTCSTNEGKVTGCFLIAQHNFWNFQTPSLLYIMPLYPSPYALAQCQGPPPLTLLCHLC